MADEEEKDEISVIDSPDEETKLTEEPREENTEEDTKTEEDKTPKEDLGDSDDGVDSIEYAPEDDPDELEKNSVLSNKNIMIISGLIVVLASILLVIVVALRPEKKMKAKPKTSKQIINNIQQKRYDNFNSKVGTLKKEADELYKNGETKLALRKYKQIADHEKFVSYHNMGVSYMKEKNYKEALNSFEKSLQIDGNECVASINAAVSSLYIKNYDKFNKYIKLAEKSLSSCVRDPLYHYYYALILFYQNQYIEALAVLNNSANNIYPELRDKLKTDISILLNDNVSAITHLEKQENKDLIKLGLLYSRIGEYKSAVDTMGNAENEDDANLEYIQMVSLLNYIKIGDIVSAHRVLDETNNDYGDEPSKLLPIKVVLNKKLFEAYAAKKSFTRISNYSEEYFFKLFLYFSPYKMTNNNRIINFIRRGSKSIFVDNIEYSKKNFAKSRNLATLSEFTTKGIKYALEYKIRDSNEIFKSLIEKFPHNSSLHYNLALSYAHLELYTFAAKHFYNAHYYDQSNKLAQVLEVMSRKLSGENLNIKQIVKMRDNINNNAKEDGEHILYEEILQYILGNLKGNYLEYKNNSVLSNLFKVVLASSLDDEKNEILYAHKLKTKLSDNVIANIIYFLAKNKKKNHIDFAQRGMSFLKNNDSFMESIYYGPRVGGEIYAELANVSGMSYQLKDILSERLLTEKHDLRGVLQLLAKVNIYLNLFEESFVLYNKLIDDLDEQDADTLFFGAVAAIGAKHPENAIALLELSILDKTGNNLEAYYALALLYIEAKNLEASKIQFDKIKDNEFKSRYFDFELDKNLL